MKALAWIGQAFQSGMVGFDDVVSAFPIDVDDLLFRQLKPIDPADDAPIRRSLVRDDRHGLVEPSVVHRLSKERHGDACVAPCGQTEIDQLVALVDGAPNVEDDGTANFRFWYL